MTDIGDTATISPTDASNGTGTQPSWLGSAAPSTLDDAGRALQGAVARDWAFRSLTVTAGGTADAKTLTYTKGPTAYRTGQQFAFIANTTNTTTCTLDVVGSSGSLLGAKTIKKDVSGTMTALAASDMPSGTRVIVMYDGTDMIWVNWQGATTAAYTVNGLTEEAAPATGDFLGGYDISGAVERKFSILNVLALAIPAGVISMYGGASAPTGYLLCDGSAVSRSTYAALFTAISTGYGVGNGSTTFNVPDLRSRVPVGYGTGTVTETQAAANFNVSDIITVDSNPMNTKPKWLTGMIVQVTTSGVLPTGISAATDYYVIRLSATTISLATSMANAKARTAVNITATGSGNHTLTCTMTARALADLFGAELSVDVPDHYHSAKNDVAANSNVFVRGTAAGATDILNAPSFVGDTSTGVTNMPPSTVVNFIIKT